MAYLVSRKQIEYGMAGYGTTDWTIEVDDSEVPAIVSFAYYKDPDSNRVIIEDVEVYLMVDEKKNPKRDSMSYVKITHMVSELTMEEIISHLDDKANNGERL